MAESKPHYEILDGLRGVAALMVVFFHVFETHANGSHIDQIINHGYLAVDFFFLLSGYVVSYAYDDRWGKMTLKDFFKRRLIRLQPMIIAGSAIGAALFYFQDSPGMGWGGIHEVPVLTMLLVMLIGSTLIPVGKGLDIRGWNEMHPLNGPAWTLFFEYIANIAYALFLRRTSRTILTLLTAAAAGITIHYALTNPQGDIIGGWSLDPTQLRIGFTRLAFPFLAGMLLARTARLRHIKHAFPIAGVMLIALLSAPRVGGSTNYWMNGLYECVCLMVMFPLTIWLGAGGKVEGKLASKACKFLGDISYPIYITHYPVMYVYMAWVANNSLSLEQSWPAALACVAACIIIAYISMRLYDMPVREWLRKKFL